MQFGSQILLGDISVGPPTDKGTSFFHADRYVRSDDHKLTFRLTFIKFFYRQVITFLVKRAMHIALDIWIVFPLGIIEHNDFDLYIRLRFESIAGKSRF